MAALISLLVLGSIGCTTKAPVEELETTAASPATATATPTTEGGRSTGLAKAGWDALLAGGCKVDGVTNPVTARVLRNTPYAMAGHSFRSTDLKLFFEKDGSWYVPTGETVVLAEAEKVCVDSLERRERALRSTLVVPPVFEGLLLKHHDIIVEQFRAADDIGEGSLHMCAWEEGAKIGRDDAGTWSFESRHEIKGADGSEFQYGCVTECKPDGTCRGYEYS